MPYGSFAFGATELCGQFIPVTPITPPAQKRFTLFIAGVDRTSLMIVNTLSGMNQMSQTSTCQFRLEDPAGVYRPAVGQEVDIFSNTTKIFGGTIEETTESAYQALPRIRMDVKCSDFSAILDKRIVGDWFPGQFLTGLTTIVSGLVNKWLIADGITYDTRDGDPALSLGNQLFNWMTARQAFNQLASATGWDFAVDYNKVLRFFPRSTGLSSAPFSIADNDNHWLAESMTVRTFRGLYRNRQYVRSSAQASALWADIFSKTIPGPYPSNKQAPGGGRIAFFTLYPISSQPIIKVNGTPVAPSRIITLSQVSTTPAANWDWYWIPPQGFPTGGNGVFQNQANAPLGTNDILEVDYQTRLSPVTVEICAAEVAARASIEGNSGYYDDVQDAGNIADPTALINYANSLLNRYGCTNSIPVQIVYRTIKDGLFANMLQSINTSSPKVPNALYLLTQVAWRDVDKDHIEYTVTADVGAYLGSYSPQFFAQLVQHTQIPQPANRGIYWWMIAQSVQGVVNPGISTGTYQAIHVCQNQVEVCQYLSVTPHAGPTGNPVQIQLLINGAGTVLFVVVPKNSPANTELRVYNPPSQSPMRIFAGDNLQINVSLNSDSGMQDVNVTLITSVEVT
jgi:hypothetical protein